MGSFGSPFVLTSNTFLTMQATHIGGIRALIVHALDERVAAFYQRHGFIASPLRPLTYFLPLHPLVGG